MVKKSRGAGRRSGEQRQKKISRAAQPSERGRWLRNGALAKYLNVSKMTLWRWKHERGYNFTRATKIDSMEFNDLDKVDAWMETYIYQQGTGRDDEAPPHSQG